VIPLLGLNHRKIMPMIPTMIRQATSSDAAEVTGILQAAARWLEESGTPMWKGDELLPEHTLSDIGTGAFYLAERDGRIAGVVKFQLEDPLFWPDQPEGQAAYVHRLAVRREFAGTGASTDLLGWAVAQTRTIGRSFLRLDCESSRPRLRAFYERFGFEHHSERQVGPYFVSRYELEVATD